MSESTTEDELRVNRAAARARIAQVWTAVLQGQLRMSAAPLDRQLILLPEPPLSEPLRYYTGDQDCLASILRGRMQKVVAVERGRAQATLSAHLKRQLKAMGVNYRPRRLPLALAVLAHAASSEMVDVAIRDAGDGNSSCLLVPEISEASLARLTPSQRDVTRRYLEGDCYAEIAAARAQRPRTVANQLAAVFGRYGTAARFDLLRAILECGQRLGARSTLYVHRGYGRPSEASARAA